MILQFQFQDLAYTINTAKPIDISLPIVAGKENPNCYYAEHVRYDTIRAGEFVGSVAEGGSCNYQQVTFIPHGNGTHTECYGHIAADKQATMNHCLKTFWFVARLISTTPTFENGDSIVKLKDIQPHIALPAEALLIRTLPNGAGKKTKQYSNTNPPYFEEAVGKFLATNGVKHLLVDLPSVDKEVDGGALLMHHAFWQFPQEIRQDCTITELVYIPDEVPDGLYILNLQIPSFELDAVPSKPVLYAIVNA